MLDKHSDGDWKTWIINLREAGLSAISINTYICAMNAYWAGTGLKVAYLKEEQKVPDTSSPEQVRRLVTFRPSGRKPQARACAGLPHSRYRRAH